MKRYFFSGLILGIVLLFLSWWGFFEIVLDFDLTGGGKSNFTTEKRYVSPDQNYTAYQFIESGGGAAGWCFRCIGINGSDEEHEVFRIVPAQTELEVEWIDVKTLSVTYLVDGHTSTWRSQPKRYDDITVIFNPISP